MNTTIDLKFDLSEMICDDEAIGTLEFNGTTYEYSNHKKYNNKIIRNIDEYCREYGGKYRTYKKLVVILESPHVDEFNIKNKRGEIIGNRPANGLTGERFRKNFCQIINDKFSGILEGNYIVYLVNSVQYQCSLGVNTSIFRDYVWLILWLDKDVRDNFIDRIKNKIKPNVIINCCTNGAHKRDYSDGIMSIKNNKYNKNITIKYIENLGYKVYRNVVIDKNNIEVLRYDKANEISLKKFVKYQIDNVIKFTGVYKELGHPISWF